MKMMDDDDDMNAADYLFNTKEVCRDIGSEKDKVSCTQTHLIDSVFMDKSKQNSVKKTKFK